MHRIKGPGTKERLDVLRSLPHITRGIEKKKVFKWLLQRRELRLARHHFYMDSRDTPGIYVAKNGRWTLRKGALASRPKSTWSTARECDVKAAVPQSSRQTTPQRPLQRRREAEGVAATLSEPGSLSNVDARTLRDTASRAARLLRSTIAAEEHLEAQLDAAKEDFDAVKEDLKAQLDAARKTIEKLHADENARNARTAARTAAQKERFRNDLAAAVRVAEKKLRKRHAKELKEIAATQKAIVKERNKYIEEFKSVVF